MASPPPPHSLSRLPPASLAWLTWGLLASLYFVGYFQRVAPAVMVDELMRDFSIAATQLGQSTVPIGVQRDAASVPLPGALAASAALAAEMTQTPPATAAAVATSNSTPALTPTAASAVAVQATLLRAARRASASAPAR